MRKLNRSLVLAALAALLVLVVAFGWLDFHAARSQTQANYTLSTGSAGEALPASMQPGQPLFVNVAGSGRLAAYVRQILLADLANAPYLGTVQNVDASSGQVQGTYLQVHLGSPRPDWTPVYATANLAATLGFASTGDPAQLQQQAMRMSGPTEIQARGDITISDRSWGLISRPAYDHLLAASLAQQVEKAVKEIYRQK